MVLWNWLEIWRRVVVPSKARGALRRLICLIDAASALIHLLEHHDGPKPVKVGTGEDLAIAELATLVADVVGYRGAIDWDTTRPDCTPHKLLDIGPLQESGWRPSITLPDGIRSMWERYRKSAASDPVSAA